MHGGHGADEEMRTGGVITWLAPIASSKTPYHFQVPVLGLLRSYKGRLGNSFLESYIHSESLWTIYDNMWPGMEKSTTP